jgi:ribose transport system substrate-binding protein
MKRALLVVAAVILSGCGTSNSTPAASTKVIGDITIAYSGLSTSSDFWTSIGKSAADEAEVLGVKFVDVTTETEDAAKQKAAVDDLIATQKPTVIIIGSVDPTVWSADTIGKAKAAGILIFALDKAIDDPYVTTVIATDQLAAAGVEGDYICHKTSGKGTIVVIGGTKGDPKGDARMKGVSDKASACGMTVTSDWGDWDTTKDVSIAQDGITSTPDLSAVFVARDDGAAAVAARIKFRGLTAKIGTYGFEALPVMLTAIKAGDAVATVKEDTALMGRTAVDDAILVAQGGTVAKSIAIPGLIVDAYNVDKYLTAS